MLSEVVGAVSEIQKEATNSVRTPCFNHKLNLSIAQSNKVICIRNAVGTMKECIRFFDASAKRQRVLKQKLGRGLSGLCETRWIERHDGVLQFSVDLPKILETLETISSWADSATSSKANLLCNSITDSFFLVSLLCLSDILSLTLPLSKMLQKKNLGLDEASSVVSNLRSVVGQRRSDAEQHFDDIWKKAEELASSVDTELKPPRPGGVESKETEQIMLLSLHSLTFELYIPLLDHVLLDLKERFSSEVLGCFHLPSLLPVHISGKSPTILKEKSKLFANKFHHILPSDDVILTERLLLGELTMWQAKWSSCSSVVDGAGAELPLSSLDTLKACDPEVYPLIHTLLSFLTTLPVSNATAERSFSVLRRLKSWLRTTMKQDRLNGLALMHIHRADLSYSWIDKIIDRFAKKGKRLIDLTVE
ncbi:LOW QUALITY PROTEIN: 52 kDa repressor of the inhibitor of the protein kinase [Frankliniella fusca]|uniref:52 kDa repressor of the inhibitor of the protein kinase n=1 Tax=Frankliniella fusca TaxID=407009 RepID=A0AAE1HQL1_9NEOP|nr:LOW QUALITY PROTEIN: 52 kDa repressor of the inhibitor of the protein kinase [Frankliniella fusca]